MLTEGFGPGAIAVAVVGVADEGEFAARSQFLFYGAEVSSEFVVDGDAEVAVFDFVAKGESELFFHRLSEIDGLDFPAEAFLGALGELVAEAGFVDAGAFEVGQREQRIELGLDLGVGLLLELEAEAVADGAVDLFADIDDAEVVVPGDIKTQIEFGTG